jgi:hypothetical protein
MKQKKNRLIFLILKICYVAILLVLMVLIVQNLPKIGIKAISLRSITHIFSNNASNSEKSQVQNKNIITEEKNKSRVSHEEGSLSSIPSSELVKVATLKQNYQVIKLKGIGEEVDFPILVVKNDVPAYFFFDMRGYKQPKGEYTLINVDRGIQLASSIENKPKFAINFRFYSDGTYAFLKDGLVINLIKVVEDLHKVDVEKIRKGFFK